jgi:hypothetical protein
MAAIAASASSARTVPRRVVRWATSAALRACSALLATITARVATRLDASEAFTTPFVCVAAAWAIAPAALETSCVDASSAARSTRGCRRCWRRRRPTRRARR